MNNTSTKATTSADAKTILFDVGGKMFRVSRSLIDNWPESMLARLVSDTWRQEGGDSREEERRPIFVDRNGDTFQVVLDYMRYGCIALPRNLPRWSFIREVDYYGIHVNDDDIISPNSACEELDRLRESLAEAEMNHDMFVLAVHAYHKFMIGRTNFFLINNDDEIGLKRKPSEYYQHSMMASMVLSSNLKTYYGLKASDVLFHETWGLYLTLASLEREDKGMCVLLHLMDSSLRLGASSHAILLQRMHHRFP